MVLTEKQRKDLHAAIAEYLASQGETFSETLSAFNSEAGLSASLSDSKITPLLEKKWTSVVRLQRKLMAMEKDLVRAKESAGNGLVSSSALTPARSSWVVEPNARRSLTGHRGAITSLCFHPVYSILVTTSEDATAKVWDYETGDFERTLKGHTNTVQSASFHPSGKTLATCSSDLSVKVWAFDEGVAVKTLMGHEHTVTDVGFVVPLGDRVVSCSRDKTLKVWDLDTGYCVATLTGHAEWVRKLAVSAGEPDLVASCSSDHTLIVWSLQHQKPLCQMRGHEHVVEAVAFSSAAADKALKRTGSKGGKLVLSASRDKTVRLWDSRTGTLEMTFPGHDSWVRAVSFQPQGWYVLSAGEDKSIKVWDLKEQRCVRTIQSAHKQFVSCLKVHPSLQLVATGGVDSQVKLWV